MRRPVAGRRLTATEAVAPRRSKAWAWWLAGCSTLVVVVLIAGAAYGATSLFNRLKAGGFSCLPSDFPSYPKTTIGGESYSLNGPTPGNSCRMVFESNDSAGAVLDFYESRLATGSWRVVSNNPSTGDVTFRNIKKAKTTGSVHIAAQGSRTEITIQLYS